MGNISKIYGKIYRKIYGKYIENIWENENRNIFGMSEYVAILLISLNPLKK